MSLCDTDTCASLSSISRCLSARGDRWDDEDEEVSAASRAGDRGGGSGVAADDGSRVMKVVGDPVVEAAGSPAERRSVR
jgi:hypothetical protein